MLRRSQRLRPQDVPLLELEGKTIDLERRLIRIGRQEQPLSHFEVQILRSLARAQGEAVSRAELLREIWGESPLPNSRTVDYHVVNIRRKLERDPANPTILMTAHGVGYLLRRPT